MNQCPNGHVLDAGWHRCPYCQPRKTPKASTMEHLRPDDSQFGQVVRIRGVSNDVGKPVRPRVNRSIVDTAPTRRPTLSGWLTVVEGPNQWTSIPLATNRVTVGSSRSCTLRIPSPAVADHHVSLKIQPQHVVAESIDGDVRRDGAPIDSVELRDGDTLSLADNVTLLYRSLWPSQENP